MESSGREVVLGDWLARKTSQARLRLGLAVTNLNVHGSTSAASFQPTVASYALAIPRLASSLLSRRPAQRVQILHAIDGFIKSGEMLLVLGRPGSGCTTLLKALAGDDHGIYIGDESSINYQGLPYETMHRDFKGESIYLAEVDVHFPELTLGQTLTFAASTRESGPHRNSASHELGRDLSRLFNLHNAFDTWIGNAMIRGVSGGEKRRTSIAEALASDAQLQFWDNSTRGLDSATALRFIELLRAHTDALQTTVALSIYQASEAMYQKFDKVTLLYEGRQIYFGPVESAARYFHDLGFERPLRATTPDFLTSITNPDERLTREGFKDKVPRSPDEFARVWKQSLGARQLLADVEAFNEKHPLHDKDEFGHKLRYVCKMSSANYRSLTTLGNYQPAHVHVLHPSSPSDYDMLAERLAEAAQSPRASHWLYRCQRHSCSGYWQCLLQPPRHLGQHGKALSSDFSITPTHGLFSVI